MSDDTEEVVKVLYDYKYSDDTGHVEIKTGDIYRLIEKTNNEWWQVYDPSDADGESFFVPAKYVKIVSEKSPWKTISDLDKLLTFGVNLDTSENLSETEEEEDTFRDSVFKESSESNGLESKKQSQEENIEADYANVPYKPPDAGDDGEYVNLDQFRDAAGIPILKADGVLGSSEAISPSDTLTDLSETSQELIQGSVPPPLPGEGKFIRVLMKDQPWDIYKENVLGRLYFVNRETGERAWKPPRKIASPLDQLKPAQPVQSPRLPEIITSGSHSCVALNEDWVGIPSEYEQVHDNGSVYFIHKATQDKWKTLVDKVGRQYFHKLGSSDTQWTLPSAPDVPDKENLLRTTEFPVQQRERRWEPVGQRLSTFGGQSMRANKAKSTYGQIETTASSKASTLPANFPSVKSMPSIN
ncbi:unnamed protein product, partial [Candidula unifasciata]